MTSATVHPMAAARTEHVRPLWLGGVLAGAGELFIFVVFGLLLKGPENWATQLVWTVGFCGIGMGSAVGAFVDLLIVGRWSGARAVAATCALSTAILGATCNLLCWRLDLGLHYFGSAEHPAIFLGSGIAAAAAGGLALGALVFADGGRARLDRRSL